MLKLGHAPSAPHGCPEMLIMNLQVPAEHPAPSSHCYLQLDAYTASTAIILAQWDSCADDRLGFLNVGGKSLLGVGSWWDGRVGVQMWVGIKRSTGSFCDVYFFVIFLTGFNELYFEL